MVFAGTLAIRLVVCVAVDTYSDRLNCCEVCRVVDTSRCEENWGGEGPSLGLMKELSGETDEVERSLQHLSDISVTYIYIAHWPQQSCTGNSSYTQHECKSYD